MNDKVTIRPFDHGGAAREGQLDFSANISPLGVPGPVKTVLRDLAAGDDLARYPDPDCAALRAAIAGREGVSSEQVLCGNGAADLIYRFVTALRPKRALVLQPTFSEYEKALDLAGCDVDRVVLTPDDDFVWPDDLPDRLGSTCWNGCWTAARKCTSMSCGTPVSWTSPRNRTRTARSCAAPGTKDRICTS